MGSPGPGLPFIQLETKMIKLPKPRLLVQAGIMFFVIAMIIGFVFVEIISWLKDLPWGEKLLVFVVIATISTLIAIYFLR